MILKMIQIKFNLLTLKLLLDLAEENNIEEPMTYSFNRGTVFMSETVLPILFNFTIGNQKYTELQKILYEVQKGLNPGK